MVVVTHPRTFYDAYPSKLQSWRHECRQRRRKRQVLQGVPLPSILFILLFLLRPTACLFVCMLAFLFFYFFSLTPKSLTDHFVNNPWGIFFLLAAKLCTIQPVTFCANRQRPGGSEGRATKSNRECAVESKIELCSHPSLFYFPGSINKAAKVRSATTL